MSYQPHYNANSVFFSQKPSQQIAISSLPGTRLNGSVQNMVTSQKSVPKSVTQTVETKRFEVIVLSSDSESDTETRKPVVSRKKKCKGKENVTNVFEGMKNKIFEASASDQSPNLSNDLNRNVDINSSKSAHEIRVSTNLLDDYVLMTNKESPSLFQRINPVRIFLYILEDDKTNIGLFDIIVDFTKIYLKIYEEDQQIITKFHDLQTLVVDLIYCLMSKMRDDRYMATSKRFKQVELLARKAIEVVERLKETGEIIKRIDEYKKTRLYDERKRNEKEESSQENKRRKQDDKKFEDEGEGSGIDKREERKRKREYKKQEQMEREEKRLRELERELVRKNLEGLEIQENVNKIPPFKRIDHSSMPAPFQLIPHDVQPRRKKPDGEKELVNLLAEPLHNLITAQLVYDLYENFTPFHLAKTVDKCTVNRIFKCNNSGKTEYRKQLYRQYINTNMDGTTNVLKSWIKSRIFENVSSYLPGKKRQ
ncbi:hypothetical protein C1645_803231 [Glomus cerebriforme]|uniref:Uncharacterized protein n=1 Tax=Glomus cerebriforme TaxID=658196 RepID=A0A397TEU8_9GLOM|nr:hypothetical protein C1645_803231 [Glomus cerebriforme]